MSWFSAALIDTRKFQFKTVSETSGNCVPSLGMVLYQPPLSDLKNERLEGWLNP